MSGLASGGPASSHELRGLMDVVGHGTLPDMMPKVAASPLDFQPGSRWTYSALAGFDTLGRIVEVASGMSFDQFLKQRIFEPLGMKTTAFHPGDDRWPSVVTAYHRSEGMLKKTGIPNRLQSKTYFSGAGGLVSTAEEYAQFHVLFSLFIEPRMSVMIFRSTSHGNRGRMFNKVNYIETSLSGVTLLPPGAEDGLSHAVPQRCPSKPRSTKRPPRTRCGDDLEVDSSDEAGGKMIGVEGGWGSSRSTSEIAKNVSTASDLNS